MTNTGPTGERDDFEGTPGADDTAVALVVGGYEALYAATPNSPTLRAIWRTHAYGDQYPEEFEHFSFLTLDELELLVAYLRPGNGSLVDLACGGGGPGLWASKKTGCSLVGIDASPAGVAQAKTRAAATGLTDQARFFVWTFARTGLDTRSADAVMSVDALLYAPDVVAAVREIGRVLRPGGRLAFTAFEFEPQAVAAVGIAPVDTTSTIPAVLSEAGVSVEVYEETPGWSERVTATYEVVLASISELRSEMGDTPAAAIELEASLTLHHHLYRTRVFTAATRLAHNSQETRPAGLDI